MSLMDDCIFFHDDILFMVYVHNGNFLCSRKDSKLQEVIKEIRKLDLNIEDQDHLVDYVGVNIKK
jgi:hypothetical protein